MNDRLVRDRNLSSVTSLGASPPLVIPRLARAIAGKSIILASLSSVLTRVVHRGKSYLSFQVLDAYSWPYSILRSSSFKAHLKKHGLDPSEHPEFANRDRSPAEVLQATELEEIKKGQVSNIGDSSYNQAIPLPGPSNPWDAFVMFPIDTGRSIKHAFPFKGPPHTFGPLSPMTAAVHSLLMQPGLTSRVSSNSPLLLAPTPQIPPDYNAEYFLSPLRASSETSSRYSSPMAPTPVLTPERGLGFVNDINAQMNPCLGTTQDWMSRAWQDQGVRFVG